MKEVSFWEEEAFGRPCDLMVVGAGITGLSAALFFKRRHSEANIVVLDKGAIPEGASTRNAGFACVGSITEHVADLEKESEGNIKKRIRRRYEGLQLLRETLGDESIGYEQCGGAELFTETEQFEEAADYIPQFNDWLKEITGERSVYEPGELIGYDVIRNRLEGALHPGKMIRALIREVQSAGITIYWKTPVSEVEESGRVWIEGPDAVKATRVLIATNGFTQQLLSDLSIQPARGMIMISQPWPDLPWRGTFHYDRGYIYFRNVGDRLLLGGGRNVAEKKEQTHVFDINKKVKKHLQEFAQQTLQMPEDVSFSGAWSGIMGFTPTKTPIVKRLDEHRVVAAGLSGMGIAMGMKIAEEVVDLLDEV